MVEMVYNQTWFAFYHVHCSKKLLSAIAPTIAKYIACKTSRINTN